ncbi:MAG: TolC family protein [Candidatus Hydrogenedentes bacterium]|nr:TolC family protein [Candidatus Hydrogenedentota bacterium]
MDHPNMKRRLIQVASQLLAAGACALVSSCAHTTPRWSPANVAPPASFESALTKVPTEAGSPADTPASDTPAAEALPAEITPGLNITLDDAIQMALNQNRAIAVERYSPDIDRTAIPEAKAAFDPVLTVNTSYSEQNTPGAEQTTTQTTSLSSLLSSLQSATQSGTTTSGTETGTTGTGATSSSASIQNLIVDFQSMYETSKEIRQLIEDYTDTNINHSEQFDSVVQLTTLLPTGTEFYVNAGVTRNLASSDTDSQYAGTWSVGLTQPLLRGLGPAVNLVALRQAKNSAAISEYAFNDYVLDVVQQVINGYWDLALAQETVSIREFSLSLAREQLKLNEAFIDVGKLAGSARITAQAEVASQEADLVDARSDVKTKNIALWRLLNAQSDEPVESLFGTIDIPSIDSPMANPDESVQLALMYRPDLAQARLNVSNQKLEVVQTKNGLLPRLDAFASYGRLSQGTSLNQWNDDLGSSDYDNFQVGLNFEMALGNRAERARHTSAKLRVGQAEDAVRNMEQVIETDVRQAAVEVERQWKRIDASHQEVLSREEEYRVETGQFKLGRSTNLDVLQVQRDLIQAKLDEASARVSLLQAIAALHRAEGTSLARRGIAIADGKETQS